MVDVILTPIDVYVEPRQLTVTVAPAVDEVVEVAGGQGPAGVSGAGIFSLYPAGENIAAFRMVALIDDELVLANQADESHAYAIAGITLTAATTGQSPSVQRSGMVVNPAWSWTPGEPIYLGSNGQLTQDGTAITSGFLLPLGWAAEATRLWLEIGQPTFLSPDFPDSGLPPKYKSPSGILSYLFDWSDWLPPGVTISTATITVPSGITFESTVRASSTVLAKNVAGGTIGVSYPITCSVTSSEGEVGARSGLLIIVPER